MADDSSHKPDATALPTAEVRHPDGRIEHPRVQREVRDVRFRLILAFVVITVLAGAAELYVVWELFQEEEHVAEPAATPRYPLAARHRNVLPKEPRLEQINRIQGVESGNVRRIETIDLDKLNRFGPTSDEGYIHIPIDAALGLVVEKLPVRESSGADDYRSRGLVDGGESNSGRMFRGGKK